MASDLTVRPGRFMRLIGPNGAGKTTLVHLISGALQADAGEVRFSGADITALSMHQRVQRGLARSYQVTSIFRRLTVLENAALAVQAGARLEPAVLVAGEPRDELVRRRAARY